MTSEGRNDTVWHVGKFGRINDRQPACNADRGCKRKKDVTPFKLKLEIRSTEGEQEKTDALKRKRTDMFVCS